MPLIAWAYLCFAAGLIAGFLKTWLAVAVPIGILIYVATRMRHIVLAAATLACVGIFTGIVADPPPQGLPAPTVSPNFFQRQQARAAHAIEAVFRHDAPVAKALLIAQQHEIPRDIKTRYADAGIIHMLSISGLHVAIIAAAIDLLAQVARVPIRPARFATLIIILFYVALIGFQPPAVRSAIMLGATIATSSLQRPTSPWAALALGALFPLIQPNTVLNLGYQLSVTGIAGLIASAALARRYLAPRLKGWQYTVARGLLASAVSTAVTAPLVAWHFGRLSLIGPLTNLIADPVISLAQPMLFLGLLLAPILPAAQFVADAVHPLLIVFDAIARHAANIPYAAIAIQPTPLTAVAAGVAATAMVVACVSRFPARPTCVALSATAAMVWIS